MNTMQTLKEGKSMAGKRQHINNEGDILDCSTTPDKCDYSRNGEHLEPNASPEQAKAFYTQAERVAAKSASTTTFGTGASRKKPKPKLRKDASGSTSVGDLEALPNVKEVHESSGKKTAYLESGERVRVGETSSGDYEIDTFSGINVSTDGPYPSEVEALSAMRTRIQDLGEEKKQRDVLDALASDRAFEELGDAIGTTYADSYDDPDRIDNLVETSSSGNENVRSSMATFYGGNSIVLEDDGNETSYEVRDSDGNVLKSNTVTSNSSETFRKVVSEQMHEARGLAEHDDNDRRLRDLLNSHPAGKDYYLKSDEVKMPGHDSEHWSRFTAIVGNDWKDSKILVQDSGYDLDGNKKFFYDVLDDVNDEPTFMKGDTRVGKLEEVRRFLDQKQREG